MSWHSKKGKKKRRWVVVRGESRVVGTKLKKSQTEGKGRHRGLKFTWAKTKRSDGDTRTPMPRQSPYLLICSSILLSHPINQKPFISHLYIYFPLINFLVFCFYFKLPNMHYNLCCPWIAFANITIYLGSRGHEF